MASKGPIALGTIAYLKGAARVQTAIAFVVGCHELGVEACLGQRTKSWVTGKFNIQNVPKISLWHSFIKYIYFVKSL